MQNRYQPWTVSERKFVEEHYGKMRVKDIAKKMGRSEVSILHYAKKLKLKSPLQRQVRHDVEQVKRWIYDGLTQSEIARKLGLHRSAVNRYLALDCYDDIDRRVARNNGKKRK